MELWAIYQLVEGFNGFACKLGTLLDTNCVTPHLTIQLMAQFGNVCLPLSFIIAIVPRLAKKSPVLLRLHWLPLFVSENKYFCSSQCCQKIIKQVLIEKLSSTCRLFIQSHALSLENTLLYKPNLNPKHCFNWPHFYTSALKKSHNSVLQPLKEASR